MINDAIVTYSKNRNNCEHANEMIIELNKIKEIAEKTTDVAQDTSKLFDARNYPEKNLNWGKENNYTKSMAYANITTTSAKALYGHITRIADKHNKLLLHIPTIQIQLKMSKGTIIKSLKDLQECGLITVYANLHKAGIIYMINPEEYSVGKYLPAKLEEYTKLVAKSAYPDAMVTYYKLRTLNNGYAVVQNTIPTSDGNITFNTMSIISNSEKTDNKTDKKIISKPDDTQSTLMQYEAIEDTLPDLIDFPDVDDLLDDLDKTL